MMNSLSQVAVKLGSPGVPDFYQGTELWDLSLVDPDNRRPVDFERRQRLLDEVDRAAVDAGDRSAPRRSRRCSRTGATGASSCCSPPPACACAATKPGVVPRRATICRSRPTSRSRATPSRLRACTASDGVLVRRRRACARGCSGGDLRPPLGESWKTSRVLLPPPLAGRTLQARAHRRRDPPDDRRRSGVDLRGADLRARAGGHPAGDLTASRPCRRGSRFAGSRCAACLDVALRRRVTRSLSPHPNRGCRRRA